MPIPKYEFPAEDYFSNVGNGYSSRRIRSISPVVEQSDQGCLNQFIFTVREAIGVNRVAIFLDSNDCSTSLIIRAPQDDMPCVAAVGIPVDVYEPSVLSAQSGIGKWVKEHGRILRRTQAGSILSPAENTNVQREFELLNCHLAIPITDLSKTIGVALLGSPIAQADFGEEELWSIFHLMEKVGSFIKNCQRRALLNLENRIFTQMLNMLHCGALVIDADLRVVRANDAIKKLLVLDEKSPVIFDDIPKNIALQLRGAIEEINLPAPFFLSLPEDPQGRLLLISLGSIAEDSELNVRLILVTVEDFSEVEAAKRAAIETASSRLASHLQLLNGN